jgi:hypothetical protein
MRGATVTVTVANTGDRPVQVGSHFHFYETNAAVVRPRGRARLSLDIAAGTACASSRGSRARCNWWRWTVTASSMVSTADHGSALMSVKISRQAYAEMFGPTTGDRLRLADTGPGDRSRARFTIYGEEVKFGGGKVIRDGMGQSQRMSKDCVDTVITNALIIDHWGIVKADIGLKHGRIAASARPATRTSSRA